MSVELVLYGADSELILGPFEHGVFADEDSLREAQPVSGDGMIAAWTRSAMRASGWRPSAQPDRLYPSALIRTLDKAEVAA